MKKIIVVGGGAGGLELVTQLGDKLGKSNKITLIDRNNSHLWKPLLHEIAAGVLDDQVDNISYLAQAHQHNFEFRQGALLNIDRENKKITVADTKSKALGMANTEITLDYDVLVVAIGSTSNDFGTPGIKDNCIFLDDQNSAVKLRRTLLDTFSRFCVDSDAPKDKVSIAIVGGGATGIELASELPNMVKKLKSYGYDKLGPEMLDITLVEAADRVLPVLPEKVALSITKTLENLGVKVLTKTMITKADSEGLYPKEGDMIKADIMVWAAGIKAPDFLKEIAGLETNRGNQLVIKPTLQTTRDDSIFAMGDCSYCVQENGVVVSPTAQAAHQMVKVCAYNIEKSLNELPLKKFKFNDKGIIISLHDTAQGVVSMIGSSKLHAKGCFALLIHRLLYRMHQANLLGIWSTVRFARAARLVSKTKSTFSRD